MTAFLRRFYAGGGASTTLASAMGNSDTSFSISATTGWPGGSPGGNFIVVIDRGTSSEEKILCSSNSGTVVSVASSGRGYDGTSATSHNSNATVSLCGGAIDFDETNQMSNLLGNVAEGSLVYGKGAGVLPSALAIGTNGYYLTSNGTDPTWSALPTIPPLAATVGICTSSVTMTGSAIQIGSVTVPANGKYLVNVSSQFQNSTTIGSQSTVELCLNTTTASFPGALWEGGGYMPTIASGTFFQTVSTSFVATLTSGTTYYMNGLGVSQVFAAFNSLSLVRIS